MSKIGPISWREFKYTALTKAFIIGSIIVPLFIFPLLILLPVLLKQEAQPLSGTMVVIGSEEVAARADALANLEERINQTQEQVEEALSQLPPETVEPIKQMASVSRMTETELDLEIRSATPGELESLKEEVRTHDLIAVIVLEKEVLEAKPTREQNNFQLLVRPGLSPGHLEIIDDLISDAIIQVRVSSTGMDYEEIRGMMRMPSSITKRLQEGGGEVREYEWAKRLIPMAFMILVWIATFTSGNYLLTSTIEEKSNKVMEVLLSAASPMQIMSGKIIGQAFVSLVTLMMYGGLGFVALLALSQADLIPPIMIVYLLLFFIMAYFMIASIMASVGSAVSDLHDAQSLIGPAMIVLILPLIFWIPISEAPNGMLATVTSFIPPLIPFVMILRVTASGDPVPLWQVAVALIEGYAAVVVMVWMCSRIFRVGVLMQGKPPSPFQMIKWMTYR